MKSNISQLSAGNFLFKVLKISIVSSKSIQAFLFALSYEPQGCLLSCTSLKHLGFTLLLMMTGGSFPPRALAISDNIIIRYLAYFPSLHLPLDTESNLSRKAHQKGPLS